MAGIPGTNIVAPVVPLDTADVHPTHEAQYGRGGYRVVATTVDRDGISTPRREAGMLVYVTADGKTYRLGGDLTTWTEVVTASTWNDITGKPSTFAPSAHSHPISDVTGLSAALAGKVDASAAVLSNSVQFIGDNATTGTINGDTAFFTTIAFADATGQTSAFTSALRTKLVGIATGATANATDAQLRDRATHTGTQAATTITGLATVATSGSASDLGAGTLPASRIPATTVTAAAYGSASSVATFTVDSTGRLTAAGSTAISVAASAIASGTLSDARLSADVRNVENVYLWSSYR